MLVGGYHGAWLAPGRAAGADAEQRVAAAAGALAGAGVLAALPAGRCGLAETARVAGYLALESAGQCGPCFNGLPRIAGALDELAGPRPRPAGPGRPAALGRAGRPAAAPATTPTACVRFVRSALRVFAAELDAHARGRCSAADRHRSCRSRRRTEPGAG